MATDPKQAFVLTHATGGVLVMDDVLQKEEHPVDWLKGATADKFLITVPNEWAWNPQMKPFTNALHKQKYDAETLAEDLEAAGLTYVMRDISFDGWAFLGVEASR